MLCKRNRKTRIGNPSSVQTIPGLLGLYFDKTDWKQLKNKYSTSLTAGWAGVPVSLSSVAMVTVISLSLFCPHPRPPTPNPTLILVMSIHSTRKTAVLSFLLLFLLADWLTLSHFVRPTRFQIMIPDKIGRFKDNNSRTLHFSHVLKCAACLIAFLGAVRMLILY